MPNSRRKRNRNLRQPPREPAANRAAEVLTIAWTASVTGVTIADLICISAYLLAWFAPGASSLAVLSVMLLMAAALVGAIWLILLPIVWRFRSVKPPLGYVLFAVVVGTIPLIAVILLTLL